MPALCELRVISISGQRTPRRSDNSPVGWRFRSPECKRRLGLVQRPPTDFLADRLPNEREKAVFRLLSRIRNSIQGPPDSDAADELHAHSWSRRDTLDGNNPVLPTQHRPHNPVHGWPCAISRFTDQTCSYYHAGTLRAIRRPRRRERENRCQNAQRQTNPPRRSLKPPSLSKNNDFASRAAHPI